MKVLWLSHFAPFPPKGGASQRSFNMLKELSRSTEISLISLAAYSKITAMYQTYGEGLDHINCELGKICKDVSLISHGRLNRRSTKELNLAKSLFRSDPYDVLWLKSEEMERKVTNSISSGNFDLVHLDTVGLWPYVNEKMPRVVLNHHNIESAMLARRAENHNWPVSGYLKSQAAKMQAIESGACRNAFLNITCSNMDTKKLRQLYSCNSETVPNGVDLSYFSRREEYRSGASVSLIFAGGLDWYPNRDAMLFFSGEIWPLLKQEVPEALMTVVGRGKIPLLTKLAEVDSSFRVEGFVPDVRCYLEKASIYVCPIRDGGGTKLKVLDALAMGVPLVANPVACEGIDVTEGENVVYAETAAEFVEAIARLSKDHKLRERMSMSGRCLIERFYSYEGIGNKLRKLYLGAAISSGA